MLRKSSPEWINKNNKLVKNFQTLKAHTKFSSRPSEVARTPNWIDKHFWNSGTISGTFSQPVNLTEHNRQHVNYHGFAEKQLYKSPLNMILQPYVNIICSAKLDMKTMTCVDIYDHSNAISWNMYRVWSERQFRVVRI